MAVYELKVDHFLPMTEELKTNIYGLSVSDFLNLSDTTTTQHKFESIRHFLNIGHIIEVRTSKKHLSVSHHLDLTQRAGRTFYLTVEHALVLTDSSKSVEYEIVEHNLILSQDIDVQYCKKVINTLVLTQTININCVRVRTVIDTLQLTSSQNIWEPDKYTYSIDTPDIGGPNAPEC